MDEQKNKIKKWIYFIPVSIQILWIILYNPVCKFFERKYTNSPSHIDAEVQGNLLGIGLCIIVVTLILSIIIGRMLKKANYKINRRTRMLTISIHIILAMITILIPIYTQVL